MYALSLKFLLLFNQYKTQELFIVFICTLAKL